MKNDSRLLIGAFSEILILSLVKNKPRYGYEIIKKLEVISKGKIIKQAGSIYPILKKMEENGWISSAWELNEDRPKKIYHIQKNGIHELGKQIEYLNIIKSMVDNLNGNNAV